MPKHIQQEKKKYILNGCYSDVLARCTKVYLRTLIYTPKSLFNLLIPTMRIFQFVFLCFICVSRIYGQTVPENHYGRIEVTFTKEKRPDKIYAKVEIKTAFRGGDSAWVQSIEHNINQSNGIDKRLKKGKYIVSVRFILSKDGSLSEVQCENDPGFGICEAVIRVIKKTKKWFPAEQSGKAVRDYRKG